MTNKGQWPTFGWFLPSIVLCTTFHSVCLFVCLSPTGHNSKPIVMKLYQVVEVVSTEKPIDFEVKGQRSSWGRVSKIVIFSSDWLEIWTRFAHYVTELRNHLLGGQKVKGQLEVKLLKSSNFKWKIVNLHPINSKFQQDLHSPSLNWESNYFWGQKVKGQLKVKLLKSSILMWKIVNFHPIDLNFD